MEIPANVVSIRRSNCVWVRAEQVGKRIWLGPWRRLRDDMWFRDEIVGGQRWRHLLNTRVRPLVAEPKYGGFCGPPGPPVVYDIPLR